MSDFPSSGPPSGLPEVIPIFPLTGVLLLPGGRLPLNVFEPRYLALVEDSLAAGRMFGMIQPDPAAARVTGEDGRAEPGLFGAGAIGRISSFSETEDGRYLITLTGVARFAVAGELSGRRGYRRVQADYAPFREDQDGSPALPGGREAMLTELREFFDRTGLDANWDVVGRMPDDMLVTTLCMVCPFAPAEKQALLEAPTAAERAEALFALLRMGGRGDDDGRFAS